MKLAFLENVLEDELIRVAEQLQEKRSLNEDELKQTKNILDNILAAINDLKNKVEDNKDIGKINIAEDRITSIATMLFNQTQMVPVQLNRLDTKVLKEEVDEIIEFIK